MHVADVARLPAGVPDHVAGVGHLERGQLLEVGVDGGGEAPEQAGPVARRHGPPGVEGGGGPCDGGVGLLRRQALDLGDDLAGGGVADVHAVIFADGGPSSPTVLAASPAPPGASPPVQCGTVPQTHNDTGRPVQPGQGLRHARRDPGRPGVHRLARPPPHLRPGLPSAPAAWPPTCTAGAWRLHRERAELAGWESGQDHVALALYNGNEYLEGMLGSYRARVAPVQRQLPLRRRGAALPAQRRPAAGHDPALVARPDAGRGAAHAGRAPRRAAPGRGRIGPRPPPRGGLVRGGAGRILARGRAGRPLPRRPLHPLHGRHHGHAQGRAVAPARHLHGRHGRAEGGHVGDRDELRGPHRAAGRELPAAA